MEKRDYHAKLVVHELDTMKGVTQRRLIEWLETQVKELKQGDISAKYAKVFTAKLMK